MTSDSVVRARIDEETKDRAAEILAAAGLTTSSAIRLFLLKVVEEEALPFEVRRPNKSTLNAIRAAKSGKVRSAKNPADLIKKLNARN